MVFRGGFVGGSAVDWHPQLAAAQRALRGSDVADVRVLRTFFLILHARQLVVGCPVRVYTATSHPDVPDGNATAVTATLLHPDTWTEVRKKYYVSLGFSACNTYLYLVQQTFHLEYFRGSLARTPNQSSLNLRT